MHAKIYFEDGRWYLRDFGLNGTKIDGAKINGAVRLTDGKEIKIDIALRFTTNLKAATVKPVPPAPITIANLKRGSSGESHHGSTKIVEFPTDERPPSIRSRRRSSQMDEMTALCKFMTQAVEVQRCP